MTGTEEAPRLGVAALGLRGAPRRLLIVDDSPADVLIARRMLQRAGLRIPIDAAASAKEGLELSLPEAPDVVLLDLHLPEGSGFDWIGGYRERYPAAAIIMLTGSGGDENVLRALAQGAHDYLQKDELTPEILLRSVRFAMERRRFESAARQQAVTRKIVRRLLTDLATGPQSALQRRQLGRAVAAETESADIAAFLDGFRSMGIGEILFDRASERRYVFRGDSLIEVVPGAAHPTCHIALGYLEGAVAAVERSETLGSEIECQAQGHASCLFVVKART